METKTPITVSATVDNSLEKVWNAWTMPEHITKWNFASDDWCCPHATNDPRTGGKFSARMEAKDGSMGFDFGGEYSNVVTQKLIEYAMSDGRKVSISFEESANQVIVNETFDPENEHPVDFQKAGWQAIMDNFKKHAETL